MIKSAWPLLGLVVCACSTNPLPVATGEFTAPGGLAATGAGDRDVVFIANSGRDGLRALQLCNAPLQADGGVDPADPCPQNQHGQFVPAPIRVFPASIETVEARRPLRVAGVRLSRTDGSAAGAALVAGVGSSLAVVDARSLVETQTTGVPPRPVTHIDLAPDGGTANETIDVVAANALDSADGGGFDIEVSAPAVTAFAATRSELIVLDVRLGTDEFAQPPTVLGRCTLAPVVPAKLAVVPGSNARVFVADSAGDGVVSIQTGTVTQAGNPCVMDRISAGGRSVRSVAVSPPWYDQDANGQQRGHVSGELVMMVVDPLPTAPAGQTLDSGGVLFAGTGLGTVPKGVVPIPPLDFVTGVGEPMQPLSLPGLGLVREGTFLRSVKPRPAPQAPDLSACTAAPCTRLSVGQPTSDPDPRAHLFALLAAVTATDGVTYLIDVPNRRFVNQNFYAQPNDALIAPTVAPAQFGPLTDVQPPMLAVTAGTFEAGVTHASIWTATWHAAIPGLERRGGLVKPLDANTLRFTVSLPNLNVFRDDPAIALAPGDVVTFASYSLASDNSDACRTVVGGETPLRFDSATVPGLTIKDVQPDHLDLATLPSTATYRGFDLAGCNGGVGAVAEVHTARNQPWLVFEGTTVRGRVAENGGFEVHQRRYDYPHSDYGTNTPIPTAARDLAFSFSITGTPPTIAGSKFTWSTGSGLLPVAYGDLTRSGAGLATAVYAYSSLRTASLLFTSVTGMDQVLQADPALLFSTTTTGVVTYR